MCDVHPTNDIIVFRPEWSPFCKFWIVFISVEYKNQPVSWLWYCWFKTKPKSCHTHYKRYFSTVHICPTSALNPFESLIIVLCIPCSVFLYTIAYSLVVLSLKSNYMTSLRNRTVPYVVVSTFFPFIHDGKHNLLLLWRMFQFNINVCESISKTKWTNGNLVKTMSPVEIIR